MTCRAGLRVLTPEPLRVEPGAVRIESTSALRRMAGETVALGVTGDAALDVLARRRAVIQLEPRARVVIGLLQPARRDEPRAQMTRGAERALVVARGAL